MGSIRKFERSNRGVDVETRVGIVLWRRVGARREMGQVQVAREIREGRIDRGESVVDVRMRLRSDRLAETQ